MAGGAPGSDGNSDDGGDAPPPPAGAGGRPQRDRRPPVPHHIAAAQLEYSRTRALSAHTRSALSAVVLTAASVVTTITTATRPASVIHSTPPATFKSIAKLPADEQAQWYRAQYC